MGWRRGLVKNGWGQYFSVALIPWRILWRIFGKWFMKMSKKKKKRRTFISQQMYLYIWVTDILKFYEVLFCAYCKGLFCLVVLIFLCICIKHFQHEEMKKNNSKLNFTKNRRTTWFSHGRLKMSLAWLGECWKSKVIALNSWCKQLIDFVS